MRRVVFELALLLAALLYASVVIVEVPDDDARPVLITGVADGDTVDVSGDRRVRLVGYDAYEQSEPLGRLARDELRSLCLGEAYLDVDDLEPRDGYGRILGYMWCRRGVGNITWYVNVQNHFIVGDGRRYVKRLLYIPPDEHPYTLWMVRHVVKFDMVTEIYVYNDTKSPHKIYGDAVVLTSGVYEVYYGGQLVARLRLMSHTPNTTTINLPKTTNTTAPTEAQRITVTQTVTRTVTVTTTVTQTKTVTITWTTTVRETTTATYVVTRTATATVTNVVVVEKPYVHPITYVVIAAAVAAAILAVYLTRSKPMTQR
jgi:hypothetical protein